MTTAHRPTWNTAKGGSEQGGNLLVDPSRAYSSKDMPAHLTLKSRQIGQGNITEQSKIDFKSDLIRREVSKDDDDEFKIPLPVKRLKIEEDKFKPVYPFIETPFP